jgi:hypothetical protein
MRADTLLALVPRVMERLATMKKGPVHKCLPVGLALAVHLLVFTQASLAADIDCRSDSGIPSGARQSMWTTCASRLLMQASPSVAFISARPLAMPEESTRARPTMACFGLICLAICTKRACGKVSACMLTLIKFTAEASLWIIPAA